MYDLVHQLFEYKNGELYWKVRRGGRAVVGSLAGNTDTHGYRQVKINGIRYLMHRIIFLMHHGYLPEFIDHIDNDRLNNKIDNLREANRNQNAFNMRLYKTNTSGSKGVSWDKNRNKWMVRVGIDGVDKYFGHYEDIELADLVASEARCKLHGVFARDF